MGVGNQPAQPYGVTVNSQQPLPIYAFDSYLIATLCPEHLTDLSRVGHSPMSGQAGRQARAPLENAVRFGASKL